MTNAAVMRGAFGVIMSLTVDEMKQRGNDSYRQGEYTAAITSYTGAIHASSSSSSSALHLDCLSNRAQCHIQLSQWVEAIADTDRALQLDDSHVKASYRRAFALGKIGRGDEAIAQLRRLLRHHPDHHPAANLHRQLAVDSNNMISAFNGLIERHAQMDDITPESIIIIINHLRHCPVNCITPQLFDTLFTLSTTASIVERRTASTSPSSLSVSSPALTALTIIIERSPLPTPALLYFNADRIDRLIALTSAADYSSSYMSFITALILSPHFNTYHDTIAMLLHDALFTDHRERIINCIITINRHDNAALSSVMRRHLLPALLLHPISPSAERAIAVMSRSGPSDQFSDMCSSLLVPLIMENDINAISALSTLLQIDPLPTQSLIAKPHLLEHLLDLATGSNAPMVTATTQVLALASTSTAIRKAISDADYTFIFIDALDAPNHTVAAFAAVALAKIASINTAIRQRILHDQSVIRRALQILGSTDDRVASRVALEAILYLSVYAPTKAALQADPSMINVLMSIADDKQLDAGQRYALAQIIRELSTSSDDLTLERQLDSDTAKLQSMAAKGLPAHNDDIDMIGIAGQADLIDNTRKALMAGGVGRALFALSSGSMTLALLVAIAKALLRLSSQHDCRGRLVADGALRLLVDVHGQLKTAIAEASLAKARDEQASEEKTAAAAAYDCKLSCARLLISTNPSLLPDSVMAALPTILLDLIDAAMHEMHEYEALLALTNIASIDAEQRERLYSRGAWTRVMSNCITSTNELVQVAALELLANLVSCQSACDRLRSPAGADDIRVFLLFARASDDARTLNASLGALAIMSDHVDIARSIAQQDGADIVSKIALDHSDSEAVAARARALIDNLAAAL